MTSEEKDLLLRDICGRLSYEVILVAPNGKTIYQTDGNTGAELLVEEGFKPYLRPMSSMTEEERKEYKHLVAFSGSPDGAANFIDWLNKNMFDYRWLIEKDLAIAVTEENNPYKE